MTAASGTFSSAPVVSEGSAEWSPTVCEGELCGAFSFSKARME